MKINFRAELYGVICYGNSKAPLCFSKKGVIELTPDRLANLLDEEVEIDGIRFDLVEYHRKKNLLELDAHLSSEPKESHKAALTCERENWVCTRAGKDYLQALKKTS